MYLDFLSAIVSQNRLNPIMQRAKKTTGQCWERYLFTTMLWYERTRIGYQINRCVTTFQLINTQYWNWCDKKQSGDVEVDSELIIQDLKDETNLVVVDVFKVGWTFELLHTPLTTSPNLFFFLKTTNKVYRANKLKEGSVPWVLRDLRIVENICIFPFFLLPKLGIKVVCLYVFFFVLLFLFFLFTLKKTLKLLCFYDVWWQLVVILIYKWAMHIF